MPNLHPRELLVKEAELDLLRAWLKVVENRALTTVEELRVLANFAQSQIGGVAKYMICEERHGDADKPGGVE
jgi:hypothetical protein